MFVIYLDQCEKRSPSRTDFETSIEELECSSPETWGCMEDIPQDVIVLETLGSHTGRILSMVQRDEFSARYVDKNQEITLTINH